MSAFAPPARRGDFFYSSVLYADAGNSNHHPRASVAELAALLRPEAPNLYSHGRKPEPSSPAKDPAWHYYSAQLIHYGLAVTKNKNTAKVRLLDAMNQFKLEVPAWVLKMEGELKKEWEAENRKIKKGVRVTAGSKAPKAKAAPNAGAGVNVTVNLSLASGLSILGGPVTQQPSKPTPKRKRAGSDAPTPASTAKKAAKVKNDPTPTTRVKKEPASKVKKEPAAKVKKEPVAKVKKEPAAKRAAPRVKHEHPQSSPPNSSGSYFKHEYNSQPLPSPRIKTDPYARSVYSQDGIVLSGLYDIDCSTATDMFNDYDLNLTLAKDSARGCWWATFRWGAWDGIIQITQELVPDRPIPFAWRLRDLETGKLTFGKRCTGQITCFSGKTMWGELHDIPGVGTVAFEGRRVAGQALEDDLQHEWDGFVAQAYGR